jgi:RNase adapter protein RapZ
VSRERIIIVTGRSGSGKSTALAALEDAGFYCVDNMPVALLPKFVEQPFEGAGKIAGFAFVMDLREKAFLSAYPAVLDTLRGRGYRFEILFLEANEKTLLQRYSQTRRPHPLAREGSLRAGLRAEKEKLSDLRRTADRVIDTSDCTVHELKSILVSLAQKGADLAPMRIQVLSFGFKYGAPPEADLVMDVRFLPNPFFVPDLRPLDGESEAIQSYVLDPEPTRLFLEKFFDLLDYLIPLYKKEGKAYLTIAVGCTGGRHRSVAIARRLFEHLLVTEGHVELSHRDISEE